MSKELKAITKEMDKFEQEAEENDKATKKWSTSLKVLAGGAVALGGAIGAVKILQFGKDLTHTATQISKFSINTEIAEESISSLFTAVKVGGGDIDAVGDITQDFTEKLGDARAGSEAYKETFKALGVDINQTTDKAFSAAIKSLSEMDDQSKAMFRGIELFGDQYKVVASQIANGNNILEGSPMFSGEFIDSSETINRNMRQMGVEIQSATIDGLEPFVKSLANMATRLSDSELFTTFTSGLTDVLTLAGDAALALDWMTGGQKEFEIKMVAMDDGKYAERVAELNSELKNYETQMETIKKQQANAGAGAAGFAGISASTSGNIADTRKELDILSKSREEYLEQQKRIADFVKNSGVVDEVVASEEEKQKAIEATARARARGYAIAKDLGEKAVEDAKATAIAERDALKVIQDEMVADAKFKHERKKELALIADQEEAERRQSNQDIIIASAQAAHDMMKGFSDAIATKKMNDINATEEREIRAIKTSTMSEKKKNEEIAKIQEKAEEKKYEQALKDWKRSMWMIQVDTMAGMAKTWATVGYPAAIPLTIAMGAQSSIATATAMANKPKFEDGGIVGGMGGGRQGRDNVEAVLGKNERVITVDQQLMLSDFFEGKMGGGGTNITINAVSSEGVEDAVLSALYSAQDNGKVDNTRLSIGAN